MACNRDGKQPVVVLASGDAAGCSHCDAACRIFVTGASAVFQNLAECCLCRGLHQHTTCCHLTTHCCCQGFDLLCAPRHQMLVLLPSRVVLATMQAEHVLVCKLCFDMLILLGFEPSSPMAAAGLIWPKPARMHNAFLCSMWMHM